MPESPRSNAAAVVLVTPPLVRLLRGQRGGRHPDVHDGAVTTPG